MLLVWLATKTCLSQRRLLEKRARRLKPNEIQQLIGFRSVLPHNESRLNQRQLRTQSRRKDVEDPGTARAFCAASSRPST